MKKVILITIVIILILGSVLFINQLGKNNQTNTKEQANNTNISYLIYNDMSYYNSKYDKRGVYYNTMNKPDSPHFYTIAMGEKNKGGYSITIKDVNMDVNGNIEVIVQENVPGVHDVSTMAFTYPICMLELDGLPNSIIVKNIDGILFENINF